MYLHHVGSLSGVFGVNLNIKTQLNLKTFSATLNTGKKEK
jgi:hypothetical protein